ncbi:unnamed protein product [Rhizoctonia solani]|uniref:3'-5' exonuclease domain-containing protein n=1 Tax=Rhizoctonia solani TaxID=456999 RepID=A0A8H2XSH5_9AGAM|nr:unnamed protein product [Rhizoctonia solani]
MRSTRALRIKSHSLYLYIRRLLTGSKTASPPKEFLTPGFSIQGRLVSGRLQRFTHKLSTTSYKYSSSTGGLPLLTDTCLRSIAHLPMPAIDFIDSPETLSDALDSLCTLNLAVPSLFIGMHGIRVSRNGRLCILDIYVPALEAIFMIDITVLDHLAFSTSSLPPKVGSRRGLTLKAIFESPEIPKVFYDEFISTVRSASDNLFNAFDISLQGVVDLQIYELAVRVGSKRFLNPLALSIMNDIRPSESAQQQWSDWITSGQKFISPELGGNLRVWDERPLRQELVNYCMADVIYLPRLLQVYESKLSNKPPEWSKKIEHEVQARLKLAEDFAFDSCGKHMARAPADWR